MALSAPLKVLVVGAGAWGTSLALSACTRHTVTLWARHAQQADTLRTQRRNTRYLADVTLPEALHIATGDAAALGALAHDQDLVVIATPVSGLRATLLALRDARAPVAWLCKGFEADTGLLPHEVQQAVAPGLSAGVLSGPSFAQEVAAAQPSALVAASPHALVRDPLVEAFHGPALRVYPNHDWVGVEVGGAVKNVLAIAAGLCDGLSLGLNARAALLTRGLAEITRLGVALGARPDTFMGLSGLGDLVLTATGDLSRNRRVGLLLAQGMALPQVLASLGHVAEGVACARTVAQRAQALGVQMPITDAVVALIDGRLDARHAVAELMAREVRAEGDAQQATNIQVDFSPQGLARIAAADVARALAEDVGAADLTAGLVDPARRARARVICRDSAVICGAPWVEAALHALAPEARIHWQVAEGQRCEPGALVFEVEAPARALLSAERTMLNFLQLLSAVATKTAVYVDAVKGTRVQIVDTRKTLPGLRLAQKYAVRCGGGTNHRIGLFDAVLIKENHIAAAGGVKPVLQAAARVAAQASFVEIEVETLSQLDEALAAGAKMVLLDNMPMADLHEAVRRNAGRAILEISGGVTLDSVRALAQTGVDRISIGALTKDVKAVDFSMRLQEL